MVIEIDRKHILMMLTIVILYCALLIAAYFSGKEAGYNEGLEFRRDEMDAIKEDLEKIINPPTLIPNYDTSI